EWHRSFETRPDDPAGDPACAFGPDGTAYLTMIPMKHSSQAATRLPFFRSEDGGRSWHSTGASGYLHREPIAVDGTGGRCRNRPSVHGEVPAPGPTSLSRSALRLYTSVDGGRTFDRPAERVSLNRHYIFGTGNSVILSDGRWLAVFGEVKTYFESPESQIATGNVFPAPPEPESAWLQAVTSDDGGDSLNEAVTIGGWHMPNPYVRQSFAAATVAVDASRGPFRDRLYVVWTDSRRGGTDILFAFSSDRGRTWSSPIVVNDERRPLFPAPAPNHLLPAVAVNDEGIVAVTWLDRRDAPDNLGWRLRLRASIDGGETFLPSPALSPSP